MRFAATAFERARTTLSCPTSSSNRFGRQRRAMTVYPSTGFSAMLLTCDGKRNFVSLFIFGRTVEDLAWLMKRYFNGFCGTFWQAQQTLMCNMHRVVG